MIGGFGAGGKMCARMKHDNALSLLKNSVVHRLPAILYVGALLAGCASQGDPEENCIRTAATGEQPETAREWIHPTHSSLELSGQDGEIIASWTYDVASNNDVVIAAEQFFNNKSEVGEVMLIGGLAIAVRGLTLTPPWQIQVLDVPLTSLMHVETMLARAFPGGPQTVQGTRCLRIEERVEPLSVTTPSAEAHFQPPWSIDGSVSRNSDDVIFFDLIFRDVKLGKSARFVGSWTSAAGRPEIPDETSLVGWNVLRLGPREAEYEDGAIFDFGASPVDEGFKTVGELRATLSTESDAAAIPRTTPTRPPVETSGLTSLTVESRLIADEAHPLVGFWRENCGNDFGLAVDRTVEGLYSVSFCGPGGCSEPGTYRANTNIVDDPMYRIIGDERIMVWGGDGFTEYRRCAL